MTSPGAEFERQVVERYTHGLLEVARRQLPRCLRVRVDPEDVLQSVYRSFFRRLNDGQFVFDGPDDLWRVLATMTFRKACNLRKFHLRQRRDARRETLPAPREDEEAPGWEATLAVPTDEDVDLLWDCLEELLRDLPESSRTIVALRLQGEPIDAIAQQVCRSRRTVLRVLAAVSASAIRLLDKSS